MPVSQPHRQENRRHKRIYFSPGERVSAQVFPVGGGVPVRVDVLDVSESGIGLSHARGGLGDVAPGVRLRLAALEGWADIEFTPPVEIEIKWVLDHEFLGRIAFGSEFLNMAQEHRLQLRQMIG